MMVKYKNIRPLVALLLAFLVTFSSISLFTATASAADTEGSEVNTEETAAPADDETEAPGDDTTEAPADEETDQPITEGNTDADEDEGLGLGFWISLGILGVLVIIGAFFAITRREKLAKWLRGYRSELNKVVWMPWNDVRKSTLVVIVVIVTIGAMIAMLDFVFSKGIISLGNLL